MVMGHSGRSPCQTATAGSDFARFEPATAGTRKLHRQSAVTAKRNGLFDAWFLGCLAIHHPRIS